ncbi:uncharacterized protein FOMMEDRAFT_164765 [Fomitiporia mediterranea MF3/22]|uniref:uncharacterized protein n=1 Tax=Fomitiporia mediterranea (strain MF3/22) TaxID=694068 RepID=UPI000440892E|nr:uncharacterized protein FOMMEDRAFT_164765 [Fomitiporia mediterranea MF3/22]EJD07960.1 hypothetical protein FOMMEDRAFT_164765 [Fomitiporia mediterranea MF3/22]
MTRYWSEVTRHLNFFRIHLLFFIFSPLIFSAIFYAANGQFHISYIDALFNCVSASVVCGLATVDLSSLTGFQQALLFIQSALGTPVLVSWVMVYVRRQYFAKKFQDLIQAEIEKGKAAVEHGHTEGRPSVSQRFSRVFTVRSGQLTTRERSDKTSAGEKEGKKKRLGLFTKKTLRKLRPDMISRMDDAPKRVDPSGWISEEPGPEGHVHVPRPRAATVSVGEVQEKTSKETTPSEKEAEYTPSPLRNEVTSNPEGVNGTSNGPGAPILGRTPTIQAANPRSGVPLGHSLTVEFRTPDRERDLRGRRMSRERRPSMVETISRQSPTASRRHSSMYDVVHDDRYLPHGGVPLARRQTTQHTQRSNRSNFSFRDDSKHKGYGGFPYPTDLALRFLRKVAPGVENKLVRTVTIPNTRTMSTYPSTAKSTKTAPYFSFNAIIGRNSKFHLLTEEQLEELGGVEYRALTALLWIVAGYYFVLQLAGFTIIAPYMSIPRWKNDFVPPALHRPLNTVWFSAFQVVSAFTNTGMSLVDQSMIPFQEAYPMIFVLAFLILWGNTAFPVFLRFVIWCIYKCSPSSSRLNETLHFLLDHPRRCFIYLFPSHQTWFLLTVVVLLSSTDWFFFLVLDIGNATMEAIPIGVRFAIGFLQASAVRAAGFATVSISSLAPAVQALYVVMMYVSIYPVALSIRATNVYEEKSLGVYEEEDEEDVESQLEGPRTAVWGQYLARHARRQLAFDMWWLALAVFLLCIIERSKIQDSENFQWFTIFTIIFELMSAYGGVGLSLGLPYANYSFSGAFTPLSKLIVCAVMIRGRHRGLPNAIDRAVMLPFEFKKATGLTEDDEDDDGMETNGTAIENEYDKEANRPERILEESPEDTEDANLDRRFTDSPEHDTQTPRASDDSQSTPR